MITTKSIAAAALALMVVAATKPAAAQYGNWSSSSYSNSYSKSWGSSYGYGPNGTYNTGYNNESAKSSVSTNFGGYYPNGGYSYGNSATNGYNYGTGYSNGYIPKVGAYKTNYGNYNQFNNGNKYYNVWNR